MFRSLIDAFDRNTPLLIVFLMTSSACVNRNQKRPQEKDPSNRIIEGPSSTPGEDPTGEVDTDDGGGGDADADDNDDDTGADALQAILKECGGENLSGDENEIIYKKTIRSVPKKVTLDLVTIETRVDLVVTPVRYEQDAKVEVEAGPIISLFIRNLVEKNSGKTISTNVPISDYSSLSDYAAWQGMLCTMIPALRLENLRGGSSVVAFDPPLPINVSPRASAGRFAKEIGDKKIFNDITAKVISSDRSELPSETEIVGSVTVEKVVPEMTVDDGEGGTIEIKADLALKVTYDFGSPETTMAIGLSPQMTFFIDHQKKDLVANVLDTKSLLTGEFVFIHKD